MACHGSDIFLGTYLLLYFSSSEAGKVDNLNFFSWSVHGVCTSFTLFHLQMQYLSDKYNQKDDIWLCNCHVLTKKGNLDYLLFQPPSWKSREVEKWIFFRKDIWSMARHSGQIPVTHLGQNSNLSTSPKNLTEVCSRDRDLAAYAALRCSCAAWQRSCSVLFRRNSAAQRSAAQRAARRRESAEHMHSTAVCEKRNFQGFDHQIFKVFRI